jgi:hypothetical protein
LPRWGDEVYAIGATSTFGMGHGALTRTGMDGTECLPEERAEMARINKTIDGEHADASYDGALALRVRRTRTVIPSSAMRGHSVCGSGPTAITEPHKQSSLIRTKEEPGLHLSGSARTRFAVPRFGSVS